jgi:hypothetical protein
MSFDAFASVPASAPQTSSAPPVADTTVSTQVSTPSAPPAPSGDSAPVNDNGIKGTKPNAVQIDSAGKGSVVDPAAAAAAFNPEFKFKVMDKEHEIPEMFRALIKDPDSQKAVKDIFERAYGLDPVKGRMKEYQTQLNDVKPKLQAFENGVNELRKFVSKDDYDSFLKYMNIPEEKMLQWAVNKAKYMELPPEQRQVLDAKRQAEERLYQLEKQNTDFQSQLVEQKNQAKVTDLRTELSKPDITAFAKAYDQRMGQDGKFIEAVIEVGKAAYFGSQGKVDLTAAEAVQRVVALAGGLPAQSRPTAQPVIPAQGNEAAGMVTQAEPPAKKNTLPNLAGKSATSVSKPKFKSLDEIRKHAQSLGKG